MLKPGGRVAVTVPRYGPERICWALSDEYHANEGGHIRIYRRDVAAQPAGRRPASCPATSHHAHALHAPYWWLKCAVGVERDAAARARLPPAAGLGPHEAAVADPHRRARCSTRCSARAWSSTPTSRPSPAGGRVGRRRALGVGADRCRALRPGGCLPELPGVLTADQVRATVAWIAAEQDADGALPWFRGGQLDPWDSVEAAMALDVGGEHDRAAAAYRWLAAPAAARRLVGRRVPRRRRVRARPPRATTPATSPSAPGTAGCSPATSSWSTELWPAVRARARPGHPHAAGRRRDRLGAAARRHARRHRPADRQRQPVPGAALRHRAGRRCAARPSPTGSWPPPTSGTALREHPERLRRPVALLDGLVLPGARRRA